MENKIVQIDGHSGLCRDINSHAVINTSTSDYEAFINKRKKEKDLNNRLSVLETDMGSIKDMLSKILKAIE